MQLHGDAGAVVVDAHAAGSGVNVHAQARHGGVALLVVGRVHQNLVEDLEQAGHVADGALLQLGRRARAVGGASRDVHPHRSLLLLHAADVRIRAQQHVLQLALLLVRLLDAAPRSVGAAAAGQRLGDCRRLGLGLSGRPGASARAPRKPQGRAARRQRRKAARRARAGGRAPRRGAPGAQPVGQRRRKRRAAVRGAPRALPPAAAGPTFSMSTSMPPAAAQQRAGERCETAVGPSVFRDTARLKKRARLRLP